MDNFERDNRPHKGVKAYSNRAYRKGAPQIGFMVPLGFVILGTLMLSGCGGGGGGGGGSTGSGSGSGKIAVTQPPVSRSSERLPLSFGASYTSEYNRQTGLDDIGVASAYDAGYAGFNVRAGVVDTGVYQAHSQLSHINAGYDAHGSSKGLVDPDGHGTHVASLMAASREGDAMHGVAPHAWVNAYRIFDHNGSFAGKSGGQIIPSVVSHAVSSNIMLLNNSWASNYEVTDLSKATTRSVLGAELPAWEKAVDAGMVMVWAAGNQGDDEVSVRAGLPYHYSGVKKGWLAVVSFDPNGKEPRYTNRCGVARDWCLAAPGGGDSVSSLGLYGARSGGGYERRSGTSMAAPHVSGALALVLDAFPQLTPQQAAVRLLETATYEGLETADGCTISKCDAAQMADVFGQGRVSIPDAIAPIGSLSLAASAAPVSVNQARIDSGLVIDEALFSAMTGVRFIAHDSFDNAAFALPATAFLSSPRTRFQTPLQKADIHRLASSQDTPALGLASYIGGAGAYPNALAPHGRLHDISQRQMQNWSGIGTTDHQGTWQGDFGYDRNRQVMMMRRTLHGNSTDSWVSLALDQAQNQFLDSRGTGALSWGKSQSFWMNAGHQYRLKKGAITAEYQRGQSRAGGGDNCLICDVNASFQSWEIAYQYALDDAELGDSSGQGSGQGSCQGSGKLEIALHQPLYMTEASFALVGASRSKLHLRPQRSARELALRLHYDVFGGQMKISQLVKYQTQEPAASQLALSQTASDRLAYQIAASWQLSF